MYCCNADVVILTVTEIEYNAIQHFFDWQDFTVEEDDFTYQKAVFLNSGNTFTIIHTKVDEMGMTAAAATAMKTICMFKPKYIVMVGIAAGVALGKFDEQLYGDVVVADIVWNYSVGKFVSPDLADIIYGDVGFKPRPTSLAIPEKILPYLKAAAKSEENQCHVYIGPMACGSSVVANNLILEKQIHSQYEKTAGLDMESYAVAYAALHAPNPKPCPIIVKSVCDFADSKKSDDYQRFAAYTSSEFAKLLIEKFLPMDDYCL